MTCLYRYSTNPDGALGAAFNPSLTYRTTSGSQYKKPPIYVFGCSVAYGAFLKDEETFSARLSQITKRPVYNRGIKGASLPHFYYQLENNKVNFSETKPDYIIYVMIYDQIRRLNSDFFRPTDDWYNLRYEIKNGNLIRKTQESSKLPCFYIQRLIGCNWARFKSTSPLFYNQNFDIVKTYFDKSKEIIQKESPNTKFVILLYDEMEGDFWYFNSSRLQELSDSGYIVIKTSDLLNGSDILNNQDRSNKHPTAKDWKVLTPLIAKKLGL